MDWTTIITSLLTFIAGGGIFTLVTIGVQRKKLKAGVKSDEIDNMRKAMEEVTYCPQIAKYIRMPLGLFCTPSRKRQYFLRTNRIAFLLHQKMCRFLHILRPLYIEIPGEPQSFFRAVCMFVLFFVEQFRSRCYAFVCTTRGFRLDCLSRPRLCDL